MMYYVFVKDKLISTDSILPVCLSIYNNAPNAIFHVICSTQKTEEEIKKNFILNHCISLIGASLNLEFFSQQTVIGRVCNSFIRGELRRKLRKISIVTKTAVLVLLGKATVFHFGFWEHPKLAWFTRLFSRKFFYFNGNCWGSSDAITYIDNYKQRRNEKINLRGKGVFVAFEEHWPLLAAAKRRDCRVVFSPSSRQSVVWRDFVEHQCQHLIDAEMRKLGITGNHPTVGIILSNLDGVSWMERPNTPEIMFKKTLKFLREEFTTAKIIIKPHPITPIERLHEIIRKNSDKNIEITYLHASAMAKFCDFVICNKFSFAMADVWAEGTPTVEFTKYPSHLLEKTKFSSMRSEFIDHFIQDDIVALNETLNKILTDKKSGNQNFIDIDYQKLLGLSG